MEIKVRKIHDNLNGTVTAEFDVSDELMKWFCDQHNLKEFDEDLFHEWFMNSLKKLDLMVRYYREHLNSVLRMSINSMFNGLRTSDL